MQLAIPSFLRNLPRLFRSERRQPASRSKPVTLSRQRIYILPTYYGVLYALLLFVLLIGCTNYNNNLGFILTFMLASIGMIAIMHTYNNMSHLTFHGGRTTAVFCGEPAKYCIHIGNQRHSARYAIELNLENEAPAYCNVEADASSSIYLTKPTSRRGWQPMGRLTIATRFPLGLFRAWSHLALDETCLVYPQPGPARNVPLGADHEGGKLNRYQPGNDDFHGFRNYQPGDSPRHVNWKAVAHDGKLLTKQFSANQTEECWLDWEMLSGLDGEARLSQLCRWVIDTEAAGQRYGLKLPNLEIAPAHGEQHYHRCLEALAVFELTP